MSSSSVNLNQAKVDASTFTQTSSVTEQIKAEGLDIANLIAMVQALIAQMKALDPPTEATSGKDKKGNPVSTDKDAADYAAALMAFQGQIAALNTQLDTVQTQMGQAQAKLQQLQNSNLPAAEQADARKLQAELDAQQKALANAAAAIEGQNKGDENSGKGPTISVKVVEKKLTITLQSDPSFKETIRAFALMVGVIGEGSAVAKAASTVRIPPGVVGGGLPPVGTP